MSDGPLLNDVTRAFAEAHRNEDVRDLALKTKRTADLDLPAALDAIAEKTIERKTGARGLRSILESVLLDIMYELPGMEDVSKVVIDENMITSNAKPILIYADQPKVSGSN